MVKKLLILCKDFCCIAHVKEISHLPVRKGSYKRNNKSVDFIVRKNNRTYVAEAKCWPAYQEGRLKKLSKNTVSRIKEEVGDFLNKDFINFYKCEFGKLNGKILIWWDFDTRNKRFLLKELELSEIVSIKNVLKKLKGLHIIKNISLGQMTYLKC